MPPACGLNNNVYHVPAAVGSSYLDFVPPEYPFVLYSLFYIDRYLRLHDPSTPEAINQIDFGNADDRKIMNPSIKPQLYVPRPEISLNGIVAGPKDLVVTNNGAHLVGSTIGLELDILHIRRDSPGL